MVTNFNDLCNSISNHSCADWNAVSKSLSHCQNIRMTILRECAMSPNLPGAAKATLEKVNLTIKPVITEPEFHHRSTRHPLHRSVSSVPLDNPQSIQIHRPLPELAL